MASTTRRAWSTTSVLARHFTTAHPLAIGDLRRWRRHAGEIPDPVLRRHATGTHDGESLNAEGAALFATLAPLRHTPALVRLLVAYQVMYDYLDTITEDVVPGHAADCRHLHRALLAALTPGAPHEQWYALHPEQDDGGYLDALVTTCQQEIAMLPHTAQVTSAVRAWAQCSLEMQTIAHARGPAEMRVWARWQRLFPTELRWWERAAAASSSLPVHVLLAIATGRALDAATLARANAYCAWLAALNTLLESTVDADGDADLGHHNFSDSCPPADRPGRLSLIAEAAERAARTLPNAAGHLVILAGMTALYVSDPRAATTCLPKVGELDALAGPVKLVVRARRMLTG